VSDRYARLIAALLAEADIEIGGSRPWEHHGRDPRFYERAIAGGSIGIGESFMDGLWDCPALDQAIARMLRADLRQKLKFAPWMAADIIRERQPNLPYVWPGLRPRRRFARPVVETERAKIIRIDAGHEAELHAGRRASDRRWRFLPQAAADDRAARCSHRHDA
jgi:hypothetical protein